MRDEGSQALSAPGDFIAQPRAAVRPLEGSTYPAATFDTATAGRSCRLAGFGSTVGSYCLAGHSSKALGDRRGAVGLPQGLALGKEPGRDNLQAEGP
jgi:hypothetical protein